MYSGTIDFYILFPRVVNLEDSYVTTTLNEEIRNDPCFKRSSLEIQGFCETHMTLERL